MLKGYDVFFEEPGVISERICLVCGTLCNVERNRVGPTSWIGAMGKIDKLHDYFTCPNIREPWHEQALELVESIDTTPSKRIAALMQQDLIDLLNEHGYIPKK